MFSRHRNLTILTAVLITQLLVLAYQVHQGRDLPLIRQWSILLVTPIEKSIRMISTGTVTLWRDYLDLRGVRRESEQLLRELNDVKLDNQRLQSEAEQSKRLQVLLDFKQQVPSGTVAARVISSGGSETARLLVLDKGEEAGLRPDMAVVVPDGIVGKVLRVFPRAAQVLLLTDANSGVACLLENSRIHGVLKGLSKPLCTLGYVQNDEKVQIGEKVFTSGEDQIYPKGLPVGVVVEAHTGPNFQEISVQPFARLNRLEEVLVVTRKIDVELPTTPAEANNAAASPPAAPEGDNGPKASPKPGETAFVARPVPEPEPSAGPARRLSPP